MKPTVIIRADSSSTIGTGHIMRDLVLAERAFADHRVVFVVRDLPGHIYHKVEAAGYSLAWLESDDIEALIALVKQEGARTVVIDHYGIDADRERQLKEATETTILAVDDTYARHHCDILLNPNFYADPARYKGLVPDGCTLRCGEKWLLVREAFRRTPWRG
jgi:spore coat polysaccharide biosynthesis predicted glycosyltransferase SpsG